MADDADEVKVFRNTEPDDLDPEDQTGQDNLEGDKKDVVLETELESNQQDILLGDVKPGGAFSSQPQPSSSLFAGLGGMVPSMAFSPSAYGINGLNPMAASWLMMSRAYGMHPPMSPSFMPCFIPPVMSPSHPFMNMIYGAGSPLYGAMSSAKLDSLPASAKMNTNGGNPLNQMNNIQFPYQGSPLSSLAKNPLHEGMRRTREGKVKKEEHIKKPKNAFMWYMTENKWRLKDEEQFKEKHSAELNKEMGKRWGELSKEEQRPYYDMAKKEREDHKVKHPNWSARENYAAHPKKKRKRDKADESADSKKCRARFGKGNEVMWCKPCIRKKKCTYQNIEGGDRMSASTSSAPSPMTSSMGVPSPLGSSPMDHNGSDSDSESDIGEEADEATLTQLALQEVAQAMMG